jgi:hypothetical protein
MELESIFAEPELRRCWLLSKALESASLDEALRLARAAEGFLGAGQPSALPHERGHENGHALTERLLSGPPPVQPLVGFPMTPFPRDRADEQWILPSVELEVGAASAMDHIGELAGTLGNAGVGGHRPDEEVAHEDDVEDEPADSAPQVSITSDLAVLAGMEDVVRYLRQQDDVVVSAGTDVYLVNGRFQLSSAELFVRANKIRRRHGKPQFQLIPRGFPPTNGGAGIEHMQDRT